MAKSKQKIMHIRTWCYAVLCLFLPITLPAQIKLSILSTEARVINPRKVSVTFEISGELSCYKQESISIESRLPENACRGLHARYESAELMFTDAVCEKTFAVNEQFSFPGGKPKPSRLVSSRAEFVVSDSQLIGTKVIVKGSAELAVCYLSDEVNYPVFADNRYRRGVHGQLLYVNRADGRVL